MEGIQSEDWAKPEYYVDSDNDGHRYIVPYDKRKEFQEWSELDSNLEEAWELPEYAKRLDGSTVIFKEYRLE